MNWVSVNDRFPGIELASSIPGVSKDVIVTDGIDNWWISSYNYETKEWIQRFDGLPEITYWCEVILPL